MLIVRIVHICSHDLFDDTMYGHSSGLETEGPRVQASPVSLCCVLEQDTFILA